MSKTQTLAELLEKASPRPWDFDIARDEESSAVDYILTCQGDGYSALGSACSEADADLIIRAVNNVAALVDIVIMLDRNAFIPEDQSAWTRMDFSAEQWSRVLEVLAAVKGE